VWRKAYEQVREQQKAVLLAKVEEIVRARKELHEAHLAGAKKKQSVLGRVGRSIAASLASSLPSSMDDLSEVLGISERPATPGPATAVRAARRASPGSNQEAQPTSENVLKALQRFQAAGAARAAAKSVEC